jgi:hypothetical protein
MSEFVAQRKKHIPAQQKNNHIRDKRTMDKKRMGIPLEKVRPQPRKKRRPVNEKMIHQRNLMKLRKQLRREKRMDYIKFGILFAIIYLTALFIVFNL